MKSLLYIGFEFHRKTGSVEFLLDMFKEQFKVTTCWIDLFSESPYSPLENAAGHYDVLVCLQALPPRSLLNHHIDWKHAALIPMYDGCPSVKKIEKWYPYRDFQIICFSRLLYNHLNKAGFSAKYIQYFPKPTVVSNWGNADSAFLWARREEINCNVAERLLSDCGLKRMHIHKCPDPGTQFIPPSDTSALEFSFSQWLPQKSDMQNKIDESAYYIAPRQKEGIGHSFLEAMAMGRCVIAPDNSTMNEYIEHGKTGFLYNLKDPRPLAIQDVREIQNHTVAYIQHGYAQWEQNKQMICQWIQESVNIDKNRIFRRMLSRFFKSPVKVLRSI